AERRFRLFRRARESKALRRRLPSPADRAPRRASARTSEFPESKRSLPFRPSRKWRDREAHRSLRPPIESLNRSWPGTAVRRTLRKGFPRPPARLPESSPPRLARGAEIRMDLLGFRRPERRFPPRRRCRRATAERVSWLADDDGGGSDQRRIHACPGCRRWRATAGGRCRARKSSRRDRHSDPDFAMAREDRRTRSIPRLVRYKRIRERQSADRSRPGLAFGCRDPDLH